MLCFCIDRSLFPPDTFWLLLSLFCFAHSVSSVCVMFCSSSCIPVAHLAPCTRKKRKTYTSSSNKDRVAVERFCTKCPYRTLLQRFRDTHSEEIADIFQVSVKQKSDLLIQNNNIHRGPGHTAAMLAASDNKSSMAAREVVHNVQPEV